MDSDCDETTERKFIRPSNKGLSAPEPLFHFEEEATDLDLQVHTVTGEPLAHINHIDTQLPPGAGSLIHDPVYAK